MEVPIAKLESCGEVIADTEMSINAVAQSLIALAARQHGEELTQLVARVQELKEQVAGLRRGPTSDDGRRRLQHPELKTTYPEVAVRGLIAATTKYRRDLGQLLIDVIGLSVKLGTAEEELAEHRRLEEQARAKHIVKDDIDLYPAAALAVNRLYKDHAITHHHWAAASPDSLRRVAEVLIGREGG